MNLDEFLRLNAPEDLATLVSVIARTALVVWESIPLQSSSPNVGINPSGETQRGIDVYSNDEFAEALVSCGAAGEIASEEMAEVMKGKGSVNVAMDPLDGSSNVETNNPLGSIFGFYDRSFPCSGRSLRGGLYVTYGNSITLTLSLGKGVHRFSAIKDGAAFRFELTALDLKIPSSAGVYGVGAPRKEWLPSVRSFVDSLEDRGLRIRYCGTFVGDYNQVLSRGGIFSYPELVSKPKGKLRLLYETAPMSYINEQAGGYASDGRRNILDVEPENLSSTSPVYIGSAGLVRELERLVSQPAQSAA